MNNNADAKENENIETKIIKKNSKIVDKEGNNIFINKNEVDPETKILDVKIEEITEKYSKNVLRNDEIEKIASKRKFITELIDKNETIIKIEHISGEALKYFQYLSFDDRIEPEFKEMINFLY